MNKHHVSPDNHLENQDDCTNQSNLSSPQELLTHIHQQLMTDEERQAYHTKIKAESYMRWLAFYYLGRREHSQHELRQKLLAKHCEPVAVDQLLIEFAEEGYQSDERMTSAMIKEGIRKGHGHRRILQDMRCRGLKTVKNLSDIDKWIEQYQDFFVNSEYHIERDNEIDWLFLAVEAREKKYGATLPTTPKDKAKQLRFLQYRGFKTDICFQALKYNLDSLND